MQANIVHIILKVTSICNLSCKYCYVYNKKDNSHFTEPDIMGEHVIVSLLKRIEDYCNKKQIENFIITFHGGEPLMAGIDFYMNFVALSKVYIQSTQLMLSIQTNGTLLSEEWCVFFKENNISVGLSLDGDRSSNRNRIFKNKVEAFDQIIDGYKLASRYIPVNVLSVINTSTNPENYYLFFKNLGVKYLDCLLPDMTYETLDTSFVGVGHWLCYLYNLWFNDKDRQKPRIRLFYDLIDLIIGESVSGGEMFGNGYNGVIDVRSDGKIDVPDTLRICNKPLLGKSYNLITNAIEDIENETIFNFFFNSHQSNYMSDKCNNCLIKDICGGGLLAHRYSIQNGFYNPSIYCHDIFILITHIQNSILDRIDQKTINETGIQRLSLMDYTAW